MTGGKAEPTNANPVAGGRNALRGERPWFHEPRPLGLG